MGQSVNVPVPTSPTMRVSFADVFQPRRYQDAEKAYYSIVLMVCKAIPAHMAWLKQFHDAAKQVLETQWPDPATRPRTPLVGAHNSVIKDGDTTVDSNGVPLLEKNSEYAGHYIIRASSAEDNGPISVVGPTMPLTTLPEGSVYGGCWCNVNVNPYGRLNPSNKGISCGLNGVQKVKDDEPFGSGRPAVDTMFAGVPGAAPMGQTTPAVGGVVDPFAPVAQPATAQPAAAQPAAGVVDPFAPVAQPATAQPAAGAVDPSVDHQLTREPLWLR